jgi:hypothetical protein
MVLDDAKQEILGAAVYLIEPNQDIMKKAFTGVSEAAQFSNVKPSKKYVLIVAAGGYETFTIPALVVKNARICNITVVLTMSEPLVIVE